MAKPSFSSALQGVRILIVEDDSILAMNLENHLMSEGCNVIGPVSRQAKGLEVLEEAHPDAAVLDLNLHGELATDLAEALVARKIPFVIVTGYGNRHFDVPALQEAPRLHKPVDTRELVRVLSGVIRPAG
jgi:two-component SAPR family response regulator